jgi:hypothetical protein
MSSRSPFLSVLALAAALSLAGCSSPGTNAPAGDGTTQTDAGNGQGAAAATGEEISGDGYSYRVPEGWAVPEEDIPGFTPDTLAADLTDTDGFADNVNTIFSPAGEVPLDQVETAGTTELEGAGGTEVRVRDRAQVAGVEAAHIQATLTQSGVDYWIEQFYMNNAGKTLIATFSFSHSLGEADRDAVVDSVLASWSWD